MRTSVSALAAGQTLSPLIKPAITREQLSAYAEASGDHNPIHLNDDFARMAGLDGVIAHGMLSMGFLGQFVSDWMSTLDAKPSLTRLKVRFSAMVKPGDVLTCKGTIKSIEQRDGHTHVALDVWAENQRGERVTGGDAEVSVA
ncbi:MAG TPA: MaoC/PaaZ C-terminal domain-containing protein [Ktedonobacterales bacterium]|nr:MaoC/PaaZ C-terminal domain-containing protein [Ktedonobacterales bacterium]